MSLRPRYGLPSYLGSTPLTHTEDFHRGANLGEAQRFSRGDRPQSRLCIVDLDRISALATDDVVMRVAALAPVVEHLAEGTGYDIDKAHVAWA